MKSFCCAPFASLQILKKRKLNIAVAAAQGFQTLKPNIAATNVKLR
jgi:hypothetical protein